MALGLAIGGTAFAGCTKTFRGEATQPNPLVAPNETLRVSEPVVILTGDMELSLPEGLNDPKAGLLYNPTRYKLTNAAKFTVVSRDRLRFHVQIEHKWKEYTDLDTWEAFLIDDQGHRYSPDSIERAHSQHLVTMWDREKRSVARNRFGDIVHVFDDGYKDRQTLGSLSVFRGTGDFVFYSRDIFTPDVKKLTLVLHRRTIAFTFTWSFAEDGPPGEPGTGADDAPNLAAVD